MPPTPAPVPASRPAYLPTPTQGAPGLTETPFAAVAPGDAYGPPAAVELCRNCSTSLGGAYCGGCGQRHVAGRLTVRGMLDEVAQQLLVVDRGLWFTAAELTRDPGRVIRQYLDGQRRRYLGPITYLSIVTAVQLLVIPLVFGSIDGGMIQEQARQTTSGPHPMFTPAQGAAYARFFQATMEQMLWAALAMVVPFAYTLRRTFRATGINFAESAVFGVYTFAHAAALYLPLIPLVRLAGAGNTARILVSSLLYAGVIMRAGAGLFGGPPVRTGLRAVWAYAKSYLLLSLVVGVGAIVAIKLFVR